MHVPSFAKREDTYQSICIGNLQGRFNKQKDCFFSPKGKKSWIKHLAGVSELGVLYIACVWSNINQGKKDFCLYLMLNLLSFITVPINECHDSHTVHTLCNILTFNLFACSSRLQPWIMNGTEVNLTGHSERLRLPNSPLEHKHCMFKGLHGKSAV